MSLSKKSDEEMETETSSSTPVFLCPLLVSGRERRTGMILGMTGRLKHQQFLPHFFLSFIQKATSMMKSNTSRV